jgi:hypothetical protein
VASETTNLLLIPSNFKLHAMFHSKIENTEFNLSHAILGGHQKKSSPAQHMDSPTGTTENKESTESKIFV